MPVPLHVKSHWSLGQGTASVTALATRARELGLSALALTDVENLYGQIAFHHACRDRGVRAITGVELRAGFAPGGLGSRDRRLVLLARDRVGYRSLCRIVSARRAAAPAGTPTPDPAASFEAAPDGLVALTDDAAVLERLARAPAVEPSSLGVLLVRPVTDRAAEAALLQAARRAGAAVVADPDVVLASEAEHELHELLTAIRLRRSLAAVREGRLTESPERRLRSAGEMERLFADRPDALEGSERVAERCRLDLTSSPPVPRHGGDTSAQQTLERLCRERLGRRAEAGLPGGSAYEARLEAELGVIERLGYAAYFLTVGEIVDEAARRSIPIAGRGSAAGSLVVHLLGATEPDPVAGGLLFERFLNESRRDFPDVDLDVSSARRDELLHGVGARFGPERVAMVAAHGTFQRRSAYREGLKALGATPAEVDRVVRRIAADEPVEGSSVAAAAVPPAAVLPDRLRRHGPLLERLVGTPHYVAVHPGGLVVGDRALRDRVPLERTAKGVPVAQYDLRSLEHTGLLKIDLLGNHCLAEIAETLEWLRAEEGPCARSLRSSGAAGIPVDDAATLAAIERADTVGCFQLESPAMRSLLRQLPIRGLEDVVAALALVRPGAASGRAKRTFVSRAREERAVGVEIAPATEAARPAEAPLYEEDVIRLLHDVTGLSLGESDALRARVVEAGDDPAETARLEARVLALAAGRGVAPEAAAQAWARVRSFAAYAFSKAHAASYALLGYRAAYLRTHVPVPFACAVLNHHGGIYPLRTLAVAIGAWGVRLLPPDVQRSAGACAVERAASGDAAGVRVGLAAVRHLSLRSRGALLREREAAGGYRDLADLLRRVAPSRREIEALVLSGACDALLPLSRGDYPFAHEAVVERLRSGGAAAISGAADLRACAATAEDEARLSVYRRLVRARNELRYLGMAVTEHPLAVLRREAQRNGCVTNRRAVERVGETVRVAGLVAASRRVVTRSGAVMRFVTLEDETGLLEAVAFPGVRLSWEGGSLQSGAWIVAGVVRDDHGDRHLAVTGATPFQRRSRPYAALSSAR